MRSCSARGPETRPALGQLISFAQDLAGSDPNYEPVTVRLYIDTLLYGCPYQRNKYTNKRVQKQIHLRFCRAGVCSAKPTIRISKCKSKSVCTTVSSGLRDALFSGPPPQGVCDPVLLNRQIALRARQVCGFHSLFRKKRTFITSLSA